MANIQDQLQAQAQGGLSGGKGVSIGKTDTGAPNPLFDQLTQGLGAFNQATDQSMRALLQDSAGFTSMLAQPSESGPSLFQRALRTVGQNFGK